MRKIIAVEFYTIDGMMSDPEEKMAWVMDTFNDEMGKYQGEIYDSADALFLGARTFKIFEGYWPNAASIPGLSQGDIDISHTLTDMQKFVFSRSIPKSDWKNTTFLREIDPKTILEMKNQPGKNILVVGSADIVRQLTDLGLIDEYHLSVHPVVLAKGKSLFANVNEKVDLKLEEVRDFGNGVVLLKYKR